MNELTVSQTAVLWRHLAANEHDVVVITGDHRAMAGRGDPWTGTFHPITQEDMMAPAQAPAHHPVCSCGHSKYRHSPVRDHKYCTINGCSCTQFQEALVREADPEYDNGGDLV